MDKQLVKAEILWTRECPLQCSYCAMIDYKFKRAPIALMVEGIHKLKALGCEFFAIYGASPLWDYGELPQFIHEAEMMGISTTIITDGIAKDTLVKLDELYDRGLRSLTVSWDGMEDLPDKWVKAKSSMGLPVLQEFKRRHKDLRDVEVVATITRQNLESVLKMVPKLSDEGIWFSFDFVHPDRGHPGTKCRGQAHSLKFESNDEDEGMVMHFVETLMGYKEKGMLIHQSLYYLETLSITPDMLTCYKWKCTTTSFPSWVTIDADGTVLPCDDFFTLRDFKVWEFDKEAFELFQALYRDEVNSNCNGCMWSTHFDAAQIKKNEFKGLSDYKHE